MKELNKKVFLTVFGMLTFFLCVSLVIINIVSYRREYEGIKRNLNIMENHMPGFRDNRPPDFDVQNNKFDDFENMRIMDYDVYTVELNMDGTVSRVFELGNDSTDFDAEAAANEIVKAYEQDTVKISNLYIGKYSFNYKTNNSIVIIDDKNISVKIRKLLLETLIVFIVVELLLIFVSKILTGWITKPAREAFEKQREFIADASHELKTPLAVIMASSDELESSEKNKKYIENIKYESDRMNHLIAGLLDLSKLEEGVSKESYKEENLSKIVEKTALVFEGVAFEQGVLIDTDIEKNIILKCSKEEIEKLISTLLDNAVQHSDKDSTVEVKLYKSKNNILLKIINSGEPIKEGDEDKIFERFYRADKSRNRSENRYGLGLAIAKRIVINHGGIIKASSDREERKTTFKIEFKGKV